MDRGQGLQQRFSFGDFVLDVDRGAVFRGDEEIRLRPQSFRVLCYLVENHGRLVSRGELLDAIWGNTVVTDGSLSQCLIDIRRVLGDESRELIRTSPRRGYIFDAPVVEPASAAPAKPGSSPAGRRGWPIAFVVALTVAAATAWLTLRSDDAAPVSPAVAGHSIAVLPFVDMSEGQDQEYFSDGISEEILNELAQSPDLRVIARTSSFSLKGKDMDIPAIAEMLDVAYVLEGSLRRSGDRVRISAQLIDTATSAHLWSDTFDRELPDILVVQREIARAVADALQATLSGTAAGGPASAEAYELYLHGRFFHNRRADGDPALAEDYYRRALSLDPSYGAAWAGLAGALIVQIFDGQDDTEGTRAAWREAVEMALEHAPDLAETQVRAAQYYWHAGDEERSYAHRRRALVLGPGDPLVLTAAAGVNVSRGRLDLAIRQYRRALERNPLSAVNHANFADLLLADGRLEEALIESRKAMELSPFFTSSFDLHTGYVLILRNRPGEAREVVERWPRGHDRDAALAMIHHAIEDRAEADAALARLIARAGTGADPDLLVRIAEVQAFRGRPDEAFRWLEEGRDRLRGGPRRQRGDRIHYARLSPFLMPLRSDPRWESIVAWDE